MVFTSSVVRITPGSPIHSGDIVFIYDTYPYKPLQKYDHYDAYVTEVVYEPRKWWQLWKKKKTARRKNHVELRRIHMRVTKIIREYVEREVGAKFDAQVAELGRDYKQQHRELEAKLKELAVETEAAARAIALEMGFSYHGFSEIVTIRSGGFTNPQKDEEIVKRRAELQVKRNDAIESILLNLELGETTKAELRDAIDAVVVE